MDYDLAKQLKDAGFKTYSDNIVTETNQYERCVDEGCYCSYCSNLPHAKIPTLSELIEACGDKWFKLVSTPGGWSCELNGKEVLNERTPEEAVAKLWLALNAKPR